MIPREDDFYLKNGKKLPNSSKNPNRILPTVNQIKIALITNQTDFALRY